MKRYLLWFLRQIPVLFLLLFVSVQPVVYVLLGEGHLDVLMSKILSSGIAFVVGLLLISAIRHVYRLIARKPSRASSFVLPKEAFCVRISFLRANIVALLLIGLIGGFVWLAWPHYADTPGDLSVRWLGYVILLVFLHEVSHALGWLLCGAPFRSVHLGFNWRFLAPYAHCDTETSMGTLRFALLLPLLTTGILPLVAAFWLKNYDLGIASAILIGGAGGDLSMWATSIPFHRRTRVMDHPGMPAFVVLNKGNLPSSESDLSTSS